MQKIYYPFVLFSLILIISCGTPNDPESIIGGDGGYKIVGKLSTSGYPQDVVVVDTLAYVTQGEGGLAIIDVSDHKSPFEVSSVIQFIKGYSNKVIIRDSVVYISAGAFGISVIGVVDPANPVGIHTNYQPKPAEGFDIWENFLFTAIGEYGFKISDISYPPEPDPRGETSTPGFAQALCVTTDRNYLLVACGEMGFALFNISELQNGWGTYPMTDWIDTPGYAEDVVSHPTLPYAFMACGSAGLFIIDYSDSADVKILANYQTGGYAKEVEYRNGKAYVTTEMRGLQIFDVSNLNSPVRIGTVETDYAMGVDIDENYVYVADELEGLIIISIPK